MSSLEVADIFRRHGADYRHQHAGHLSLEQLKAMAAIEHCRSASLGGHVLQCESCEEQEISYNSCRNRHCPKCQSMAAKRWLEDRQAELLPVKYFHVVFTLPAPISGMAYQNKSVIYALLMRVAAETLITIAADTERLGARIGVTMVLHTWGSALTHHPHVHCIVPGGGISADGQRWIASRPRFFLSVNVLSERFMYRFLEELIKCHERGELQFFGQYSELSDLNVFKSWLEPLKDVWWHVYAKPPFARPETVLEYLSRYTHRVAIANSRLISIHNGQVVFKYKDYRKKGRYQKRTMRLDIDHFIQRFLMHVVPTGFHRIRHYGLWSNARRSNNLAMVRNLMKVAPPESDDEVTPQDTATFICRSCSAPMIIIEIIPPNHQPRAPPNYHIARQVSP